jgi:hypothetical protein
LELRLAARRSLDVALSYSSNPSSTQIVVWHDDRWLRGAFAVPAAVAQLLLKQSVGETIACLAEIRTDRKHPSVDTGLDLAFEERRVAVSRYGPPA